MYYILFPSIQTCTRIFHIIYVCISIYNLHYLYVYIIIYILHNYIYMPYIYYNTYF
jgi:hypothetical protein